MQKQIVEVRSTVNDNVVMQFEQDNNTGTNFITAGYKKVCDMFRINRVEAGNRYYITKG